MLCNTKPLFLYVFTCIFALSACGEKSNPVTNDAAKTPVPEPSGHQSEVKTNPVSAPSNAQTSAPLTSLQQGKRLYKRCVTCHSLEEDGRTKTGPNLYNIFGAKIAANRDFNYSNAFKQSDIVWTDENLTEFIRKPSEFIPKTKMSFAGIRKDEDIAAILEYMRSEMAGE